MAEIAQLFDTFDESARFILRCRGDGIHYYLIVEPLTYARRGYSYAAELDRLLDRTSLHLANRCDGAHSMAL
jgi:hypothetical protein